MVITKWWSRNLTWLRMNIFCWDYLIYNKICSNMITSVLYNTACTVQCRYCMVNFLRNPYNRHSIVHPWGRDMRCLLWVQTLIYVLPQSVQWYMQYHVILDLVITAPDCSFFCQIFLSWNKNFALPFSIDKTDGLDSLKTTHKHKKRIRHVATHPCIFSS